MLLFFFPVPCFPKLIDSRYESVPANNFDKNENFEFLKMICSGKSFTSKLFFTIAFSSILWRSVSSSSISDLTKTKIPGIKKIVTYFRVVVELKGKADCN